MVLIITVTQENIDAALLTNAQFSLHGNPIALALVDLGWTMNRDPKSSKDFSVHTNSVYHVKHGSFLLPGDAVQFNRDFDNKLPVYPFCFKITN